MTTHLPHLFSPGAIGGVPIRNRLIMPPVNTNYGDDRGFVTDRAVSFIARRAAGGVGAMILEAMQVDAASKIVAREMGIFDDAFIPGLRRLTEAIHGHGAAAFVQLNHGGPKAAFDLNGVQCVSASAIPVKKHNLPRALDIGEIPRVVALHADAARRAQQAGFDGVELQACHFYLLNAFMSGYLNHRTDAYGGSMPNRARIVVEVIRAIKERCGSGFPVIARINAHERLPGGITVEEGQEMSVLFEQAGCDCIHASAADADVNPDIAAQFELKIAGGSPDGSPPGALVPYAEGIKRRVGIPVITVGKIFDPRLADAIIRDGRADFVAMARALIVDPDLPRKAAAGRFDDIEPCTECRTCHTSMQNKGDMQCAVNAELW